MASILKVDKLDPQSGTALEIGTSGDTITVPSGATFNVAGTMQSGGVTVANTPAFAVGKSAVQTISSSAATKVTFDTEYFDSDGAFASDKFTCPSGGAGKYLMAMKPYFSGNANLVKSYSLMPYRNGAAIDYGNTQSATTADQQLNTTYATGVSTSSTFIVTLAETDYVECYVTIVTVDASDPQITNYYTSWGGYRLIGV